jgi:hypothetical protein
MAGPDGERTFDELAGVVDLFGALTDDELVGALGELAFKQGQSAVGDSIADAVDAAVDAYYLVAFDPEANDVDPPHAGDDRLLLPGPRAFPTLPPDAEDLPHILDVERRTVDREAVAEQVGTRFQAEAADAIDDGDSAHVAELLDVSYDMEAWGPVAVQATRARLDDALADD